MSLTCNLFIVLPYVMTCRSLKIHCLNVHVNNSLFYLTVLLQISKSVWHHPVTIRNAICHYKLFVPSKNYNEEAADSEAGYDRVPTGFPE